MNATEKHPAVREINPVLIVTDMQKALAYYTEKLGFELSFAWEEDVSYAILKCNDQQIHLSLSDTKNPSHIYLFCDNVSKLYPELKAAGANISQEIKTMPWEMIEFEVTDSDGNKLVYGESVQRTES